MSTVDASTRTSATGTAADNLRRQAHTVKEDTRDLASAAGAAAREQLEPARDYIIEKPLQSLLIAAGVGLVLGLFMGRK